MPEICFQVACRRVYSSRARYPSDVPRVPNGLRPTEHPNHIKRRELFSNLKSWIPIVNKYAKENPVGPMFFGPISVHLMVNCLNL